MPIIVCVAQTLARTESTTRPCPRVVLVVCTAIVSSGLEQVQIS